MLYAIAHFLRDKLPWIWDLIDVINSFLFSLRYGKKLRKIEAEILKRYAAECGMKIVSMREVPTEELVAFFAAQPEEAFTFFKPHEFDAQAVKKVVKNKAFLTFVVVDASTGSATRSEIVGYFFLRCFVNGKAFRGKMVDKDHQGRGIAKLMGVAMTKVATTLGVRMFGSISPENYASLASAKASNEVKIHKTLENGYYYIEFLPKEEK